MQQQQIQREKPNNNQNEGFDELEEEHQILVSKNNYEKQENINQVAFGVPAPNPILTKNVIQINKPKVLIRQIQYYLQPQQLLSSSINREIFSQDKQHNQNINNKKNQKKQQSTSLWQKYVISQQYQPIYLKYYKDSLQQLWKKSYKKYKLQMYKLCNSNPNIFSSYLVDLAFLSDYGNCLLQNMKTSSIKQLISKNIGNEEVSFDSRFQSGNLFAVFKNIQHMKDKKQYDLILQSDINTKGYSNWFYFGVRVHKKCTLKFNFVNMQKAHSLFTNGMKPAIYSYQKKDKENVQWHRDGYNFSYVQNQLYKISSQQTSNYSTLTFSYDVKYDNDIIYFAANLPYSYTKLLRYVEHVQKIAKLNSNLYFKKQNIGMTISSNYCPMITLTWKRDKKKQKNKIKKKIIGVIARQHPSETVSSYVMEGFINSLITLNNQASMTLLENYIFKIIPMVNIDGVIYGNSRCDLSGTDINRKWTRNPNKYVYPIIAAIRTIFNRLKMQEYQFDYFIDLHGHSRLMGTFFYGCRTFDQLQYKELAWIMAKLNTKFVFDYCTFGLSAYKRQTARGIMSEMVTGKKSLTLQTSFYGYKSGSSRHFQVKDLHRIGSTLIQSIYAQETKDPKLFNWQTLQIQLKEYLQSMKMKKRSKKLSLNTNKQNSDQSSQEGDSDSQPEADQMNEKQKSQMFLDPTVASKVGLKQVKIVRKTKKINSGSQKSESNNKRENQVKKYERIIDGWSQRLQEYVQKKSQQVEDINAQEKLKRTKNFLIRQTRSTTKIIPFKFSQRASANKDKILSLKKPRKSVQIIPVNPQKLLAPHLPKYEKKNNFWSNLKKQYEVLVQQKKKNLSKNNQATKQSKQWGKYTIPLATHQKFHSMQFS